MEKPSNDYGYRQRMQALQQSLADRLRQVQSWRLSDGRSQGGLDADSARLRRDQAQRAQQEQDRLRQLSQRQGQGY